MTAYYCQILKANLSPGMKTPGALLSGGRGDTLERKGWRGMGVDK